MIAWIDIPGLSVSYPVVQRNDNAYYLHHLITGEYNSSGSIFADCHKPAGFSRTRNTIIYGQYENGSMFGTLSHYQDQAFREENLIFTCIKLEKAGISDLLLLCRVRQRGLHLCVSGSG